MVSVICSITEGTTSTAKVDSCFRRNDKLTFSLICSAIEISMRAQHVVPLLAFELRRSFLEIRLYSLFLILGLQQQVIHAAFILNMLFQVRRDHSLI